MATQVIYKTGAKWVVNQYRLDAGSLVAVESADGLHVKLSFKSNPLTTVATGLYTEYQDANGTPYSKVTLLALLDDFLNGSSEQNGTPAVLEVEVTRPANTTAYTAGDAIGAAAAKVKMVSTVSLTGGGGTASITGTGGLTRLLEYNTSPTQTAADFVTDFAADYLALDISVVVTSSSADLIFTAAEYDETFVVPVITNVSEDLSGAVTHTQANAANVAQKETITLSGTAAAKQKETVTVTGVAATKMKATIPLTGTLPVKQKEIITLTGTSGTLTVETLGGFVNTATFNASLTQTAADFVTDHAAEYATIGVVVTSDVADIIFEAAVAGTGFTAPTAVDGATDLHGEVDHDTANVAAGTANLTVVGLDAKLITFNTDIATTISDFVTLWDTEYYATVGITLTGSATAIILESDTFGVPFGIPDVVTLTGNLNNGTIEETVAYVPYGTANVTGAGGLTKLITFETDADTTTLAFKTANAAAYLEEGIVLTNSTNTLVFEAEVAGVAFTAPVVGTAITGTVAGTVVTTQANVEQGLGTITGTGISKTITFDTDATTTALAFKTANEAYYATLGVTLTNSTTKIIFTAAVAGVPFTPPVFTNTGGDLAGVLATTATDHYDNVTEQVQIETILVTGSAGTFTIGAAGGLTKVVTFSANIQATISAFVAANAATYLAQAIVLTGTATQIVMTAEVAGTGFTAPTISGITENLTGTVVTIPTVSLVPLILSGASILAGGGGIIMGLKVESNITAIAAKDLRLWFYKSIPTEVVGDNVPLVTLYANKSARLFYVDVTMDALLVNSDNVVGLVDLANEYVTVDGELYLVIQAISAFTPTSGGKIAVTLNVLKL